ncbi:MAG: phenylalanine--tRNA ligase subunit alpha [Candidatus Pacebacteria bacterium]|nr:phenylalanine--tRNA ligase subunit alpha [Candidatus Paceibacterota bacterium]
MTTSKKLDKKESSKLTVGQGGHLHLLTQTIKRFSDIFSKMGFEIASGPEIEDEYYNFDALNFPKNHPSRDMQDTFWLKPENLKKLLRTQTSDVQIRYMEENQAPFAIIVPGKVFRNEATDATHDAQFHQCEGLVVGENITLANLKGTLENILQEFFGKDVVIRLRPGYFPFVEPGLEVDMVCFKCEGKGCPSCSHSGWIEILGAGMVHPNVLNAGGIDSRKYQGFAFGIGIDRVIMLKYGIDDIRRLYSGDLRLVNQF